MICIHKIEHVEQLRAESRRNQQLEKKLIDITNENAQRLSTSETHIAELSEQIGLIEKQRYFYNYFLCLKVPKIIFQCARSNCYSTIKRTHCST